METLLEIKNLSKSFLLNKSRHPGFKETLAGTFLGKSRHTEAFAALKNVSLELRSGDVLGIIGANGAGKSTLLRILSSITQPDRGEVNFYGKPASILDVGAGFHPELSGRENIFLSAQLYGLQRREIEHSFDRIVAFSGIGQFINEPVKNYSAGMYLRLAFAVITSVNADILIFDEVLGVGDIAFQDKIMQYILERITANQAIIMVSHNMELLGRLCNRFMLLEKGEVQALGGHEVISRYLHDERQEGSMEPAVLKTSVAPNKAEGGLLLKQVELTPAGTGPLYIDREVTFKVQFQVQEPVERLDWIFSVSTVNGINIFSDSLLYRRQAQNQDEMWQPGAMYEVLCTVPPFFFNYGYFYLNISCGNGRTTLFTEPKLLFFELKQPVWEAGRVYGSKAHTILRPVLQWQINRV